MINWLTNKAIAPIHLIAGDILNITYINKAGDKITLDSISLIENQKVTRVKIGSLKNEFNMRSGLVCVIGDT